MPFPTFGSREWAMALIELGDPPTRRQCTQDSNHIPEAWSVHRCASAWSASITIGTLPQCHQGRAQGRENRQSVRLRSSEDQRAGDRSQRHRAVPTSRQTERPLLRPRTAPSPRRHAGHEHLHDAPSPASEPSRWPHHSSGSVRFVDPSRPQQRLSCSAAGSLREPIIGRVCTHQQHLAVGRRTASCSAPLNRRATPVTRLPAGQQNWQTFHIPPVCVPTRSSVSESSTPS